MKNILPFFFFFISLLHAWGKDDLTAHSIPNEERERLDLDPFYQKRVVVGGFSIVGSKKVSDYALSEAGYIIRQMMGERDELLAKMDAGKTRLAIMASDEYTTDVPEPLLGQASPRTGSRFKKREALRKLRRGESHRDTGRSI